MALKALMDKIMPAKPLGSGAAQHAADAMNNRHYQLHVKEAAALGQPPMTPEEFAAKKGAK